MFERILNYVSSSALQQFSGKASDKFATLLRALELFNYEYTARIYLEFLSPLLLSIFAYVRYCMRDLCINSATSRQTFYPIGCCIHRIYMHIYRSSISDRVAKLRSICVYFVKLEKIVIWSPSASECLFRKYVYRAIRNSSSARARRDIRVEYS